MSEINITNAIYGVVDNIVRGNTARVRSEYQKDVLDTLKATHPNFEVEITQDETYAYIRRKKMNKPVPGTNPTNYITPQAMAEAIHTCDGNPVVTDEGVTTGYNIKCQVIGDVHSKLCLAYKIEYTDAMKNKYFIAGNKEANGLLDPTMMTDQGRTYWIECQKKHFDAYLNVLRTRIRGHLRTIRDDLRLN